MSGGWRSLASMFAFIWIAIGGAYTATAQPAWRFDLADNGVVVVLSGEMSPGIADAFAAFLEANPQIQVVHLRPELGGDPREGLSLSYLIEDRRLAAYVSEACVAACTIAFAASDRRYLESGAKLGYTNFRGNAGQVLTAENWSKIYFQRLPPAFVAKAASIEPKTLWFPKAGQLLDSGAISGYVEAPVFSSGNVRVATSLEEGLLVSPSLRVFKSVLPDVWQSTMADLTDDFDAGVTLEKLRLAAMQRLSQHRKSFIPYAADESVRAYFRGVLAGADAIARKDEATCGDFIVGDPSVSLRDVSKLLPDGYPASQQARMDDLMLTVDQGRTVPSRDFRMGALLRAFERIGPDYMDKMERLATTPPAEICTVMRNVYREILKLPTEESAAALKSFYLYR